MGTIIPPLCGIASLFRVAGNSSLLSVGRMEADLPPPAEL